jgi:hypothetical protein
LEILDANAANVAAAAIVIVTTCISTISFEPRGFGMERYGHGGYLIKVVVMALAEEVTREPSPILSWSNNNYEI